MIRGRRSMRSMRTMGLLVDKRRLRSAAGALLELSVLANEKVRLHKELARLHARQEEIEVRCAEIEEKERQLHSFIEKPTPDGLVPAAAAGTSPKRIRTRELHY